MRQCPLETYVEILSRLMQLKPIHTLQNTNIDHQNLKDHLSFLVTQGLIEARPTGDGNPAFKVTHQGINVLNFFQKFNPTLPTF